LPNYQNIYENEKKKKRKKIPSHAVLSKHNYCMLNLSGMCCHTFSER